MKLPDKCVHGVKIRLDAPANECAKCAQIPLPPPWVIAAVHAGHCLACGSTSHYGCKKPDGWPES